MNKKSIQKKSWFIPILRSKFMTIELLKMLFQHRHEVLIFLRSINKSSESFMERFYKEEIDEYFEVYSIQIKVPLLADVVKSHQFEED
jgi:hypothetical protein